MCSNSAHQTLKKKQGKSIVTAETCHQTTGFFFPHLTYSWKSFSITNLNPFNIMCSNSAHHTLDEKQCKSIVTQKHVIKRQDSFSPISLTVRKAFQLQT